MFESRQLIRICIAVSAIVVSGTADARTQSTGPLVPAVAGITLGMRSNKVVALLGMPDFKTGMLATDDIAMARWDQAGVVALFERGAVYNVEATRPNRLTNIPDVGRNRDEVITALGRPIERIDDNEGLLRAKRSELYERRELFRIPRGAEDKRETPDQSGRRVYYIEYFFSANLFVVKVELGTTQGWIYEAELWMRSLPDYGLVLVESSCVSSYLKNDPTKITSVRTQGIIRNDRDERVNIRVRVTLRTKDGTYSGSAETILYGVKPGEDRHFEILTYDVFGDARSNTYEITLAAVDGTL